MSIAEGLSGIFEDPSLTNRANTWSQTQTVPTINFTAVSPTETFTNDSFWQQFKGGLRLVLSQNWGTGEQLLSLYTPSANTIGFLQDAGIACDSGLTVGSLPAESAPAIASATVYQNTSASYQTLYIPITYSPTSTAAATAAVALGTADPPAAAFTNSEPAGVAVGRVDTITLRVPPQWYYSITVTNASIGTVTQIQE